MRDSVAVPNSLIVSQYSPERSRRLAGLNLPDSSGTREPDLAGDLPSSPTGNLREAALLIFHEAMAACSIEKVFTSKLVSSPGCDDIFQLLGEEEIDLSHVRRILVIAVGKGAAGMLNAFLLNTPSLARRETAGILIAPERPPFLPEGFAFFAGGHPLPNEQSFAAAEAAQELLRSAAGDGRSQETFCFFLLSGGASAMMELPLDKDISLSDTIAFHRALVHSGASIAEINCVRKHFSAVKGGRLAQAAGAIQSLTLAVSDVPAGRLDALGSSPTLPDPSTVEECRAILVKHHMLTQFPVAVRNFFTSPMLVETPKPDALKARIYSLLSSDDLAEAARQSAEALGFASIIDQTCDDWDYRVAADYLLDRVRTSANQHDRVCVISPGEVTVRLPQDGSEPGAEQASHGIGGRNLHFALYTALKIDPAEQIAILSAGSDGIDGNSPAAGAVVDEPLAGADRQTAERALAQFDSFSFLSRAGRTIVTGPTGNNVRDLRILLATRR